MADPIQQSPLPSMAARRAAVGAAWKRRYGEDLDDPTWQELVEHYEKHPGWSGWADVIAAADAAVAAYRQESANVR
jgi:hypothetical protein